MSAGRLRVALVGMNGGISRAALTAVAEAAELGVVVQVMTPRTSPLTLGNWARRLAGRVLRGRGAGTLEPDARAHGASFVPLASAADPRAWSVVAESRPDVLLVAGCPWIFDAAVLALPRLAAINVHPSLLPRHRGVLPYFWIYYHDDRESGVTAHRMTAAVDAGPVLERRAFAVARGMPVAELGRENVRLVPGVVRDALRSVERGEGGEAQDASRATAAPAVKAGAAMVDFERWPVERVWHFLAGLHPFFTEPLRDEAGRAVAYTAVPGFVEGSPPAAAGVVRREAREGRLACRDGWVRLTL